MPEKKKKAFSKRPRGLESKNKTKTGGGGTEGQKCVDVKTERSVYGDVPKKKSA